MDSFLKEIDTELLKRWLLNQNEDDWDVKEVNDNIVIETKYGLGTIRNLSSGCKTLQYLVGFKRYSTERVMKSLVGEFTQNEKWSVKGALMGECWYKDCCVSEHLDNLRCGKPEVEGGAEKMRILIWSEKVHKIMSTIIV